MSTLDETIKAATARLTQAKIDNPSLDARLLVGHALRLDRAAMLAQSARAVSVAETATIEKLIARREKYESVARIIGTREFWSLDFALNEATLEPRPDSETLVEVALKLLKGKTAPRLLDLGAGTGCLLLSLLHEIKGATGVGIDLAPRAVEQAAANAAHLGLASRAKFQQGNWCEGTSEKFDLAISNPPYIPSADIPALMPDVRDYDPMLALDGGDDGLNVYRLLTRHVPPVLKLKGWIVFEVGIGQADDVAALCQKAGFTGIAKHKDLGGIERCVTGQKPA